MIGFENFIGRNYHPDKTICCVLCKNHVATSKVKFTVCTYSLCLGLNDSYSCPAQSFVVGPSSGIVQGSDLFSIYLYGPIKALSYGTSRWHQCPMDTLFF